MFEPAVIDPTAKHALVLQGHLWAGGSRATGEDAGAGPAALQGVPLAWVSTFRDATGAAPQAADNRLTGALSNVDSLTVDAGGACLAPGTAYEIQADGPVTISVSDGRRLMLPIAGVFAGHAVSKRVQRETSAPHAAARAKPEPSGALDLAVQASVADFFDDLEEALSELREYARAPQARERGGDAGA